MALVNKTFSDIITFTRASTATFFNSAGVLTSAATNAPRFDYNPSTLAAQGLLIEESRANLLTYSEEFDNAVWIPGTNAATVTANALLAPSGAITADLINATSVDFVVQQVVTVANDSAYRVFSIYLKQGTAAKTALRLIYANGTGRTGFCTVDWATRSVSQSFVVSGVVVSATEAGNGWLRVTLAVDNNSTGNTAAIARLLPGGESALSGTSGTVYAWGAQLEAGAFPTSYIPTTTTALTRSADVASVNTLSPWYNATEGTIYAEFSIPASTASRSQATFGDGTANERMIISNNTSLTGTAWRIVDGGVDQADINNSTSFANNATVKVAGAYAANDFATCQGGGTVGTDTSGTLPTVTALYLGSNGAAQYASSHLRRITYYPRKLSSAELQAITV